MSKVKIKINYGNSVTVFPQKALDKILSGEATVSEIKVLSSILMYGGTLLYDDIAKTASLSLQDTEKAVSFWRGAGVLAVKTSEENQKDAKPNSLNDTACITEKDSSFKISPDAKSSETSENEKKQNTSILEDKKTFDSDTKSLCADHDVKYSKKALVSSEMPKYSGEDISFLLNKDGGKLRMMIDECQQYVGHIFKPHETETMVGICDWLGVDSDFLITLTAYYTRKKPGCTVRYIEKAAVDLVNAGITTIDDLDAHLKELELYDGLEGKLRNWLGIGGRAYTKKENATIKHWIKDLGYSDDIIKYAYDITVDKKNAFNFDYANKILENRYKNGIKTLSDAENSVREFKHEKENVKDGSNTAKSSFDVDEFFDLAMKRSYKNMASENKN